jgi:hypothetical protein
MELGDRSTGSHETYTGPGSWSAAGCIRYCVPTLKAGTNYAQLRQWLCHEEGILCVAKSASSVLRRQASINYPSI